MEKSLSSLFEAQQQYKYTLRRHTAAARIAVLKQLKKTIQKHEEAIFAALHQDLRKSRFESAITELLFTYGELDFAVSHLKRWMKPHRAGRTLSNPFSRNRICYEPKGVCLILAPWNYPFQLVMSPLISAIAAGNTAFIKPSELSPATSAVIRTILEDAFDEKEVACIEGDAALAGQLLELPFDHIFFTGSTAVGKIVMAAAARNLSSVTLELGGKSPAIIDSHCNLEKAAEKLAWGKLVNCGQTCIAPDYVMVPEHRADAFKGLYKAAVQRLFFNRHHPDEHRYGKIISPKHFMRLRQLVDEAVSLGARIDFGGLFDEKQQTIAPVLLSNVPDAAGLMQEEIFGPVLPVLTYQKQSEIFDQVNRQSKPLALYIFSDKRRFVQDILKNTSAGGTCVNDVLVHISNPKLPFGGVNGSGMGSSHGFYGFKAFSHERAVVYQSALSFNHLIYPPYSGKAWVLKLLRKIM